MTVLFKKQYLKNATRSFSWMSLGGECVSKAAAEKRALISLIKFHPLFVGIHPFADENGRIGRVLLADAFSYLGFTKYNLFLISEYWDKNRNQYIESLSKLHLENDWTQWINFFIKSLELTMTIFCERMNKIMDLYKEVANNKLNEVKLKPEINKGN